MVDHVNVRIGFFVPREHVDRRLERFNFNKFAILVGFRAGVLLGHFILFVVGLASVDFMPINVRDQSQMSSAFHHAGEVVSPLVVRSIHKELSHDDLSTSKFS
jgi:hypothetical protein